MCSGSAKTSGCQKPENLKGKPQECSPEQVRKCHGDAKGHACTGAKGASKGGPR